MDRNAIIHAILDERGAQQEKWQGDHEWGWGDCSSPGVEMSTKVVVLTEECGEVARALLDKNVEGMRRELIQVAAVCVAILEGME